MTKSTKQASAVETDVVMIRVLMESANPDGQQYKPYDPFFRMSFPGQNIYVQVPVPSMYVIGFTPGTKTKPDNYELTAEGYAYMLKYLASATARVQLTF